MQQSNGGKKKNPAIAVSNCWAPCKKWYKSPHNRFKIRPPQAPPPTQPKNATKVAANRPRSQKSASGSRSQPREHVVFLSRRTKPPRQQVAAASPQSHLNIYTIIFISLSLWMFGQHQLALTHSPPTGTLGPTTPSGASSSTSQALKLEEEVDLLRPKLAASGRRRQSHLFKIRAAPLNGKLMLPIGPITGHQGVTDNAGGREHHRALKLMTQAETFGARAPNSQSDRHQQQQQQRAELASSTTASSSARETTAEANTACSQPEEQGSIATSSQTLRLNAFNRTMAQLVGSLHQPPQPVAPALAIRSTPSSRLANQRHRGEVDKSEAPFVAATSGRTRLPLLIVAKAATTTGDNQSQRLIGHQAGPLSELGLEEAPSFVGETARFAGESILNLIDEYDSKITTNRTKAQLSCDSGEMILRLNFTEPFKGIVYPDNNRLSPCRFFGDEHHNYELRLPLRGCGTRQAAPRVFVNDVIVRFHKTLELEEDEVKTLICRYPPPLAPIPVETIGHASDNSGRTLGTGMSATELKNHDLFEFVDQQSGRPIRHGAEPPGSSGNIETFSENLIVAPLNGQQTHHRPPFFGQQLQDFTTGSSPSPVYNTGGSRLNGARHREQSADLLKPRNSIIAGPTEPFNQQNFFERLSSIELLFLISSLMFLVLLALGLVGSYYCFRRQAVRRSTSQRASAILKGKRRYVATTSPTLNQLASPAILQHYHHPMARPQHRLPNKAPSSPESDLSVQGLLSSGHRRHQQHKHQHQLSHQSQPYMLNRAYVPDGGQHYMSPAAASISQYGPSGQITINQQPMRASRHRVRPAQALESSLKQIQQKQPVLGRRETVYGYGYAPGTVAIGRQRRSHYQNQTPFKSQLEQSTRSRLGPEMRIPYAPMKTGERSPEPLLSPLGSDLALECGAPGDHIRWQTGGQSLRNATDHDKTPSGVKYALVNKTKPKGQSKSHTETRSTQQIYAADQDHSQLWRTKSLSSVHQDEDNEKPWPHQHAGRPVGGTLSRQEQVATQRRRRHHFGAPETNSGPINHKEQVYNVKSLHRHDEQLSSDSETSEPNNNNADDILHITKEHKKPQIVLKSIEDSYITNFTEIYEQEYMKRDTTRPLDLDEWRAKQPSSVRRQAWNRQLDGTHNKSTGKEPAYEEDGDGDRGDEPWYQSAHTNLRSLTELDVNFAKSLLTSATSASNKSALRPAQSLDGGLAESGKLAGGKESVILAEAQQANTSMISVLTKEESNSMPEVTVRKEQKVAGEFETIGFGSSRVSSRQQSPDLILSPDYDFNRLELESVGGSMSPRNSVSYV